MIIHKIFLSNIKMFILYKFLFYLTLEKSINAMKNILSHLKY